MIKYGLDNFTFELMEQCSIDKLNERENYWIEFYKSCDYGLNGNKGIRSHSSREAPPPEKPLLPSPRGGKPIRPEEKG